MDQIALVGNEIEDGQKLIDASKRKKIRVVAACWLKTADSDQWYLYLATPLVADGLAPAYRAVHKVIRDMPAPFWIDPFQVKIVSPEGPIARAAIALYEGDPAKVPIRFGGKEFGGVSVEAAYFYPPKQRKAKSS